MYKVFQRQVLIIVKINISSLFTTRSRNQPCLVYYKSHVIFHDSFLFIKNLNPSKSYKLKIDFPIGCPQKCT
jgi:hypothetical protein